MARVSALYIDNYDSAENCITRLLCIIANPTYLSVSYAFMYKKVL